MGSTQSSPSAATSLSHLPSAFGKHRDSSPRWCGASGCVQPGLVCGALDSSTLYSANKSADSADITAILHFQNFLPLLPKYKGTFVLNTELEH